MNMKDYLLIVASILVLSLSSCKNDNLVKKPKSTVVQKTKNDSVIITSQFEKDIRKFEEFEPYMIDDIPLVNEYSEYFKNPELYIDESLILLQKKDIPSINKTIIACMIRKLSIEDYLIFCERAYNLFEASKIEEHIFIEIIGDASQGCQSPFFDVKNRGNKTMHTFLKKVVKSSILSEENKFYIKRNYWDLNLHNK